MMAQAQNQDQLVRGITQPGGRAWFLAGLLLLACLASAPVYAQRMVGGASGSLTWWGDERVPPDNVPGEVRIGATSTGYARGYVVFRPLPPDLLLGSGPVRLFVYVLAFPRAGQGKLALVAYEVAPRFEARGPQAEQSQDGGFLWQQMSAGTILAEGEASDLAPPAPLGTPNRGRFQWLEAAPGPEEPLLVDGGPAPGWHYLELDAYASRELREAVRRTQTTGASLRLGLMARGVEGSLRLAGASEQGYEPTLALGPTYDLEIAGPGGVRINGMDYDLPFVGDFPQGQPLTIEALPPAAEAQFTGWAGDLTNGARVVRIALNQSLRLTTHYRTARVKLQVWAAGGRVELDGWCPGSSWSRDFPYGTRVRLRAVPDRGFRFVGWLGDVDARDPWLDIRMEGDRQVWAVFERLELHREMRLRVTGWGGYVLVNGCYESLPFYGDFCRGDLVHLTAVPWPGYRFVGWEGDNGRVGPRTIWVQMDRYRSVRAEFDEIWEGPVWRYHPPFGGYYPPDRRRPDDDRWRRANYDKPRPERRMSDPDGRGNPPYQGKPYPERRMEDPRAGDRPGDRPGNQPGGREPERGGQGGERQPTQRPPDLRPPQPNDKPPAQRPPAPRQESDNPRRGGQGGAQPPAQRQPEARPQQPNDKPPAQRPPAPRQGNDNPRRGGQGDQPPAQRQPEARPQPPANNPNQPRPEARPKPEARPQPPANNPNRPRPENRPQPAERPQPPQARPDPPAERPQPPANNPNRPRPEARPKPEERPQPPQARPDPPAERPRPPANNPNRPRPADRPEPEERPQPPQARPDPPAERPQPPQARPDPPAERPQPRPRPKPEDPPPNRPAPAQPPRERPQPPRNDPPRGGQDRPQPAERPRQEERPKPQDKPDKPNQPERPRGGGGGGGGGRGR